jgi:hypothetical protein
MGTNEELIDLERQGWDALSTSPQAAAGFYERVLAEEILMLLPDGMVIEDRAIAIESMSQTPWTAFEMSEERTMSLTRDCVAVVYRATAVRHGVRYTALISSTYVRHLDSWRMALHQQTPA